MGTHPPPRLATTRTLCGFGCARVPTLCACARTFLRGVWVFFAWNWRVGPPPRCPPIPTPYPRRTRPHDASQIPPHLNAHPVCIQMRREARALCRPPTLSLASPHALRMHHTSQTPPAASRRPTPSHSHHPVSKPKFGFADRATWPLDTNETDAMDTDTTGQMDTKETNETSPVASSPRVPLTVYGNPQASLRELPASSRHCADGDPPAGWSRRLEWGT